ncbi:hypothetical protein [Candidatus Halobonum tyrrellensis]|uniref:Uncharacterized protein n=1 Tax=Candidatus Halobonum tyrrellensis G22 TaxID=1324957 RepID=V4GW79_9EURY|nr:hypothetical protein [Candidatus Halobonum tyrrellensis]ESP89406.1 hypothetical protein K933_04221 [Candidatus Halobonum tyrrellensis G22]
MVSIRFLRLVSTVLLVVGALAFGDALHRTVVTGELPITSPLMVFYYVFGAASILLGYRTRQPVGRAYALGSDEERESAGRDDPSAADRGAGAGVDGETRREDERGDDGEFDPAMSPLGGSAPGDARGDDERADGTPERDRPDDES